MHLELAKTLRNYDRKNLSKDILTGLIIMAVSIPISMGYAQIAGLPAVSVPCGFDSKNLPVGMQIIGKKFSESTILNIAHQFEVYTEYAFNKNLNMGVRI